MGNAVCPQVASALGRCLALAAMHQTPPGAMLLSVPDSDYDEVCLLLHTGDFLVCLHRHLQGSDAALRA